MTGANAWRRQRRCYVPCVILRVLFLRVRENIHSHFFKQVVIIHTRLYIITIILRVLTRYNFYFEKVDSFFFRVCGTSWSIVSREFHRRKPRVYVETPEKSKTRFWRDAILNFFTILFLRILLGVDKCTTQHPTTLRMLTKTKKKSCLINSTYL